MDRLIAAIATCNRRVIHRHDATCSCIGAEEGATGLVSAALDLGRLLSQVDDAPAPALAQAVSPPLR